MKKFIVILVLTWSVAINAQPPVNYLPPNHRNGPSATYGPPGFQPGTPLGGNGRHPDSDRRPGTSYMPQNVKPGQPGGGRNGFGGGNGQPSTTYSPPRGFGGGPNGGAYGALGGSNGFGGSSNGDGRPSSAYGGGFNGASSQRRNDRGNGGLGQLYLPPSQNEGLEGYFTGRLGRNGGLPGEEESTEAAYQFQQFETQFGHQQSRDGDRATGEYNVLLPDGRKQIVQYEADSSGYKPNISYEGGNGGGGYSLRGPGGNGIGVSNGGYPSNANGGYQFGNGGGAY